VKENVLERIVKQAEADVRARKEELNSLYDKEINYVPLDFESFLNRSFDYDANNEYHGNINNNIDNENSAVIAELKFTSPSKGSIKGPNGTIEDIIYKLSKADALSILTEKRFFNGSREYLKKASLKFPGPTLRKDFIVDKVQIRETRYLGGDAVLLIYSVLKNDLDVFLNECNSEGIQPLVEVRNKDELCSVLDTEANIIGINNRNLRNLEIDLNTTKELSQLIPEDKTIISESGIKSKSDIRRLKPYCDGFLIGTEIMSSKNPTRRLRELKCA